MHLGIKDFYNNLYSYGDVLSTYELKYPALLGFEDKVNCYLPTASNCTCFNCCGLKLLGNSATNEKQLQATPNLVGIG
jgi:hypothetical protein